MVRSGFSVLLNAQPDIEVIAEAVNGREAIAQAAALHPDVILMDVRMPVLDGLQATREITAMPDPPKILVLTTFDLDDYVYEALRSGASGFLLKDASAGELADAVRKVAAGDALLAPGVTRRLIAEFARMGAPRSPGRKQAAGLTERWAAASGLTAADLGFGRDTWRPGRLGSRMAAVTAAVLLAAAAAPATRPFLNDKRITSLDGRALAYQVAFRIPVGTVLWEEIAFRGFLQAALRRVMSEPAAIAVTSAVFGVWHIRPTAAALRVNGLAGDRGQATVPVAAGVAATTAVGVLFSWLRSRSGSLTAPMLLHLTTNWVGPGVPRAVAPH